ncbi:MAG: hypothetical protein GKR89_12330 [Candidatus Latescibacteria bacterium]|nr:hypothetical protein [Candidatus Latescibacterota bacterium]
MIHHGVLAQVAGDKVTRVLWLALVGLLSMATASTAQMMGNGVQWKSGDGGIPYFTPSLDGDLADIKRKGYHLSWGPSDIWAWGDAYGYSRDTDPEPGRIRVHAIDVDNNLYLADGEDPAENGTDADLTIHCYFSWDEDNFYIAVENIDNHYDVLENQAAGANPDAFWERDTFYITFDLSDGTGSNNGTNIVDFRAAPVGIDDQVFSMQVRHYQGGEGTAVSYGNDPGYFLGAQHFGGQTDTGYFMETSIPWELIFLFDPDNLGRVGTDYTFRARLIIPDPDGDDSYGTTVFGGDQTNLGQNSRWPRFQLTNDTLSVVEPSIWGAVKDLYR